MKGRRREAPDATEESPLPDLWSPRDLERRPHDGPATFELTRLDRSSRRSALPVVALISIAVGLVGVGIAGRPAPSAVGRSPLPVAGDAAMSPSTDRATPEPPSHASASRYVVLTSPSYDGSIVEERLAVVGYVRSAEHDVAIALIDGGVALRGWSVVAATKAGDPAWQARAWFETETPTRDLPIGRSLRLVISLRARDGTTIERIERSVRIGPILEPDSRGSTGSPPRVARSDPSTLGEDGVMGALTLDGIRASD